MTNHKKAFWLGLFIIVGLAILTWFIIFLKPVVGDGDVKLKVLFSNIDRISEGTRVTYAGKPVGEVYEIRPIANIRQAKVDPAGNLYAYELILKVDSSVQVYTYDQILFATSGLLGEKSIAIIPRATPEGDPQAKDISQDVLYGESSDRFEQTLVQLTHVADELGCFLQNNSQEINEALRGLSSATHELCVFMHQANSCELALKISEASDRISTAMRKAEDFFAKAEGSQIFNCFDNLSCITESICQGQGTLGQLVQSDCLYVQLTAVLCQLRIVLDDIKNYGVLYQFDRKWQRMHHANKCN